jgi:DNA-binding IclR family transcriptional regulator
MSARKSLRDALPEGPIAGGQCALPGDVVKSAGRVLQIFELFDVLQREVTVLEISELLGYPQSSTSMLVRSLVSLGYLSNDTKTKTYKPTNRVALLGKWISQELVGDGDLLRLMARVRQRTGQAVVLASRNGLNAQYIHVVQATEAARLFVVQGSQRSLIRSGVGYALLADMADVDIRRLAMRINAEQPDPADIVPMSDLMATIADVRVRGYAISTNLVTPGAGIIAMPLHETAAHARLVIGIGGVSEVLRSREDEMVAVLREERDLHQNLTLAALTAETALG